MSKFEHDAEHGTDKQTSPAKMKTWKKVVIIVAAVLLLLAICIGILWAIHVRPPEQSNTGLNEYQPTADVNSSEEEQITEPDVHESATRKDGCYTFLVVGLDQARGNTDTIILGMLDTVAGELYAYSIPRDTLVNIPEPIKKVNSIYPNAIEAGENGIDALRAGIAELIGYEVDAYAVVDLIAFQKLVDAVGGVYYDVPQDMYYVDPDQDLYIDIKAGYQWLDGQSALGVVRYRHGYTDGDIGRIHTQQDFLTSVAKQMLTLKNIPNIGTAATIFEEHVVGNLTAGNIIWYATEFLKLDAENVHMDILPANYYREIGGLSYVSINIDEWLEVLNAHLNPYTQEITVENLNILTYDNNNNLYATTGEIAGGLDSFYTVN
jgi:LCP family protein required for cell wall assembly